MAHEERHREWGRAMHVRPLGTAHTLRSRRGRPLARGRPGGTARAVDWSGRRDSTRDPHLGKATVFPLCAADQGFRCAAEALARPKRALTPKVHWQLIGKRSCSSSAATLPSRCIRGAHAMTESLTSAGAGSGHRPTRTSSPRGMTRGRRASARRAGRPRHLRRKRSPSGDRSAVRRRRPDRPR